MKWNQLGIMAVIISSDVCYVCECVFVSTQNGKIISK